MKRGFDRIDPESAGCSEQAKDDGIGPGPAKRPDPIIRGAKAPQCNKEKTSSDHGIRILITTRPAGRIIGFRGEVITKLRAKYPTVAIRVPESGTPERVVDLWSKSMNGVIEMFIEVVHMLHEDLGVKVKQELEGSLEVRLLCNKDQLVTISKRMENGDNGLMELSRSKGVQLTTFPKLAPKSTDQVVSLFGAPDSIIAFVFSYLKQVSELKQVPPDVTEEQEEEQPYDPKNWIGNHCHEYGGYDWTPHAVHATLYPPPMPPPPPPPTPAPQSGCRRCEMPPNRDRRRFVPPPSRFQFRYMHPHPPRFNAFAPPPPPPRPRQPFSAPLLPTPPRPPNSCVFDYGHGSAPPLPVEPEKECLTTAQYSVPEAYCPAMFGFEGETLDHIRGSSGAEISITIGCGEFLAEDERLITIRGTPAQVDDATYQLQEIAYAEKHAYECFPQVGK